MQNIKCQNIAYTFNKSIDLIWALIKNLSLPKLYISVILKEIDGLKKTFGITNDFSCLDTYEIKRDCYIVSDYYYSTKFTIISRTINKTILSILFNLHYINKKGTFLISTITFNKDFNETLIKLDKINHLFYQIDKGLIVPNKELPEISEKKIIRSSINQSYKYFMNAKVCSSILGKPLKLTDENIKKGTIAVINISLKDNYNVTEKKYTFQVKHLIKNNNGFILYYNLYIDNSTVPSRQVEVKITKYQETNTNVEIKHIFLKHVEQETLSMISSATTHFLNRISKIIEYLEKKNINNIERKITF